MSGWPNRFVAALRVLGVKCQAADEVKISLRRVQQLARADARFRAKVEAALLEFERAEDRRIEALDRSSRRAS